MNTSLQMRYHRELPKEYKLHPITLSKSNHKYFISLSVTYDDSNIKQKEDIHQVLGIDLNINNIALSNGELIQTHSKLLSAKKFDL